MVRPVRAEQLAIPVIRWMVKHPRLADVAFGAGRWGNIIGPDRFVDPYPVYERIRAVGPVSYSPIYRQWAVVGYEEAREILTSGDFGVAAQLEVMLDVRPYSAVDEHTRTLLRNVLLFTDPPKHTRLRTLVNRAFTPGRIARLEPRIEELSEHLVADMSDDPRPEVVSAFARPLPIRVISALLGLPEERWQWASEISERIRDVFDPFASVTAESIDATMSELADYFGGLADERLASPRDDLVTALVQAEDDGGRLSRDELIAMVALLMFAGHETTTGALGNSIVALARFPAQRQLVRDDPVRWPNAVEELLRYDTALQTDPRAALSDVVVGGKTIERGQNLTVLLGAANRDPRRFADPDELRLDRDQPAPLSFGRGIHHCLGAALARSEMRIGLRTFVESFGDYTIDDDEIEWKRSLALRGPAVLPVQREQDR